MEASLAERKRRRRQLREIRAYVDALEHHLLFPGDLEQCKIRHKQMFLDEGSELRPLFFDPYAAPIEESAMMGGNRNSSKRTPMVILTL